MDKTFVFVLLAIAMFFGSLISGFLPIWIAAKASSITTITLYGAGLLVGVSLIIIIPEGIRAMYLTSFTTVQTTEPRLFNLYYFPIDANSTFSSVNYSFIENPNNNIFETHQIIGICLVIGFLLMVIVEQVFHIWKERKYKAV